MPLHDTTYFPATILLLLAAVPFRGHAGTLTVQAQIRGTSNSFGTTSIFVAEDRPEIAMTADWGGTIAAWDLRSKAMLWSHFSSNNSKAGNGGIVIMANASQFLSAHDVVCKRTPISVHDLDDGNLVRNFEYDPKLANMRFSAIALTHDARFVLAGGYRVDLAREVAEGCSGYSAKGSLPGPIAIFSTESGKLISITPTELRHVFQAAFSEDQRVLYAIGESALKIWSMRIGAEVREIHLADLLGNQYRKCDIFETCGPDRQSFVAASISRDMRFGSMAIENEVFVVNLESKKLQTRIRIPDQQLVRALHFGRSGDEVMVFTSRSYRERSQAVLYAFDPSNGDLIRKYEGGLVEAPTMLSPFNPGGNIKFINGTSHFIVADMPKAHVPLPTSLQLWRYQD